MKGDDTHKRASAIRLQQLEKFLELKAENPHQERILQAVQNIVAMHKKRNNLEP
jgi:hypothetical protein